jgi:ribonuclease J
MRVCVHRGTKQIGGTCVEIEASGSRIIVDLGLPLDAVEAGRGTRTANFWPPAT